MARNFRKGISRKIDGGKALKAFWVILIVVAMCALALYLDMLWFGWIVNSGMPDWLKVALLT